MSARHGSTFISNSNLTEQQAKWREEYSQIVREGINIPRSSPLDTMPGNPDDPAPPCFFYGTLMALPVLYRVTLSNPKPPAYQTAPFYVRPAVLKDHKCRVVKHVDYPGMTPCPGEEVRGTYVTGVTMRGLRRLEIFEGSQYRLAPITVNVMVDRKLGNPGLNGNQWVDEVWEEKEAMTYMFIQGEDRLSDTPWNFEYYVSRNMIYWTGMRDNSQEVYDKKAGYWKDATPVLPRAGVESSAAQEDYDSDDGYI